MKRAVEEEALAVQEAGRGQTTSMTILPRALFSSISFFPFERRDLQTFHNCKACAEEARAATRRPRHPSGVDPRAR